jgi:hypothetical protein
MDAGRGWMESIGLDDFGMVEMENNRNWRYLWIMIGSISDVN